MLSDEVVDKVIDRLTRRIEKANTYILEEIGKSIKKVGELTPSKAQQLGQMIKYGGDYDKITKKLADVTKLNVEDIQKIFEEVAKVDYQFSKQFYEYRGKKFIPYKDNMLLKTQVDALANMTANSYVNLSNTLAFAQVVNGKVTYTPIAKAYQTAIDTAILNVAQGKSTFDQEMYGLIKSYASSGIRTVDYASGRSMRLDSAVRMQMRGALRNLHNETQELIGEEIEADGVEISVHSNPAPDHEMVQGRQFSIEEYEKLQAGMEAKDYNGDSVMILHSKKGGYRPIGEYNCYHYIFSVVLGVNKPEYSKAELKDIREENNKGFYFDETHYTNYEGTQLQRQLETEIRKAKDEQIMAKSANIPEDIITAQKKITAYTHKYRELLKASGLPNNINRARVSNYKRIKVAK